MNFAVGKKIAILIKDSQKHGIVLKAQVENTHNFVLWVYSMNFLFRVKVTVYYSLLSFQNIRPLGNLYHTRGFVWNLLLTFTAAEANPR